MYYRWFVWREWICQSNNASKAWSDEKSILSKTYQRHQYNITLENSDNMFV